MRIRSWLGQVVVLVVVGAPALASGAIVGVFEQPSGVVSGVGNVAGWVYTTEDGASIEPPIEFFLDDVKALDLPCCSARGDVQGENPDAPLETGFSAAYFWGLVEPGVHEAKIVVRSTAGEMRTFTREITTVRLGDQTFLERLRFTPDTVCPFGNESPGGNASINCSNVLTEQRRDGAVTLCEGGIRINWDTATQSFKLSTDCTPPCTDDEDCDDGLFCNGIESCDVESGLCVALSSCPPMLDGCVVRGGICDEATDTCIDQADDAACDDGIFCNGIESCVLETGACAAVSACPPGPAMGCVTPGGGCDEATDTCVDIVDDSACDDGLFCNGTETCDADTGGCLAVSACPAFIDGCVERGASCDEATDTCIDLPDDSLCDDGVFCNGVETCSLETASCVAISSCPPTVPDGCVTPGAICDEATDSCVDELDDGLCLEGEVCQPDGSCL